MYYYFLNLRNYHLINFYFKQKGYLDILLTTKENDSFKVIPYMNEYVNDDVYFLKVMVIPGLLTFQSGIWNTMVIFFPYSFYN
jgi:hypothetical protein